MVTFDLYQDGQHHIINNAPGSDFQRLTQSAHVARTQAIKSGLETGVMRTDTGEIIASYDPEGKRTWPPNDTSLLTSADWVH